MLTAYYIMLPKYFFQKYMTSKVNPTGVRKLNTPPKKPEKYGPTAGIISKALAVAPNKRKRMAKFTTSPESRKKTPARIPARSSNQLRYG